MRSRPTVQLFHPIVRGTLYLILPHLINCKLPRSSGSYDNISNYQRRSMIASIAPDIEGPSSHTVPLGEGTPTKEELLVYYPAKFTWRQLKTFVNSGYSGLHILSLVAIVESSSPGILGCLNVTRNSRSDTNVGLKGS